MNTGYFQVGDKWFVGGYEVRWSYVSGDTDEPQERVVPFTVQTSGIYAVNPASLGVLEVPMLITSPE